MVQSLLQPALKPEMTDRANTYQASSQGPCCDRDCRFNVGNQCREDNGCRDESYCDGRGTACPPSILKPNKTVCNEEFVCFQVTLMMMLLRIELRRVVRKRFLSGRVHGFHMLGLRTWVLSVSAGSRGQAHQGWSHYHCHQHYFSSLSVFPFLISWVNWSLTFDDVRPVSFVAKHLEKTSHAYRLSRLYLYFYLLFVCVLLVLL